MSPTVAAWALPAAFVAGMLTTLLCLMLFDVTPYVILRAVDRWSQRRAARRGRAGA